MKYGNLISFLSIWLLAVSAWAPGCDGDGDDIGERACLDGEDNDGDGLTDCRDPDCADLPECQGCGNGIQEPGEECDGEDHGGEYCETLGFVGGWLSCTDQCTFNTQLCDEAVCGDGLAQADEECDGYDMGDAASCEEQGFLGGTVLCDTETCTYDTSQCFDEVICTETTATPTQQWCYGFPSQGGAYDWRYYAWVDLDDGHDYQLWIQLWADYTASGITTGSHPLGAPPEDSFETCAYCVILVQCADPNCQYAGKTFMPTTGSLRLDTLSEVGDASALQGALEDVSLKEVTIDWETGETLPVEAGPCYDLTAAYTLDATVTDPPQQ